MKKPLGVYIHIPFCVRKCAYCDFLSGAAGKEVQKAYIEKLLAEIRANRELLKDYTVQTVFFGGGTPSILDGEDIVHIMDRLRACAQIDDKAEISIEANPGTVTAEKLLAWKRAGISRLSFGLQSADDHELETLGRIHRFAEFAENFALARKLGYTNINVDLMSALPGQTRESWRRTMECVTALAPEHISAYSLIIEEGTPFYEKYSAHPELLPDEDEERQMYYDTKEFLSRHGYRRYEISNYAQPGFECRHNLSYWERTDYLGLGLGASSLLGNVRRRGQTELAKYLAGDFAGEEEVLGEMAAMEEYFFLGLRKTDGVKLTPYREQYADTAARLVQQGLLEQDGEMIRLTELGIDVSNQVLAEFLV